MDKITQQLSLDLVEISHNVINARQNDRLTRDLYITITNNGQEYVLPETSFVYLRGKRTDGKPIFYPVEIINSKKGQVHVDIHNYVLSCHGRCRLDIGIYNRAQGETENKEDEIASTEPFILYIPEEVFNEVNVVESDEGGTLSQLINTARDEIDEMNHLEAQVRLNEDQRQFNETDRSNAEAIRRGNENTRVLMEKTRSSAELFRNNEEEKRKNAEDVRIANEEKRQSDTAEAVTNANNAASRAEEKANDLQGKLNSHHFVLTEDKDTAGGVPGLDENTKIPSSTLYEATTTSKGVTQLTDSVMSDSVSTAATANSVKIAYDRAVSADNNLQIHNSADDSHDDIRNLISALTARLNALADSDDTTLDQLSEIVAYIKSNRELIDNITTSKVNVADIIDSLTSTATNKPLSAKQGKILNDLITALTNSTKNITSGNGQPYKVWKTDASGTPGWEDEASTSYTLPLASDLIRGGVKVGYLANGKNYPIQLSGEKMYVNVPWTDTNTTYHFYSKAIDSSFKTKFRTETKGNSSAGNYISNIRTDVANVESAPQFSAGIAWGSGDTNGYLNIDYYNPRVFIGGGNDDKLNWVKQLALIDSNVASATNADMVDGKHASDFLTTSGGTITGNLRLKGNTSYGNKLNFGDGEYVYLHEDTDDHLLICARKGISFSNDIVANGVTIRDITVNGWIYSDLIPSLVEPATSNNIGSSDRRWRQIWCYNSVNSASDRNLKKDISDLSSDERYMKFFMSLQPKSYLFKDGESGRTHIGFISQDVEEAMCTCGLTSLEFAGFCKDQKIERIENEDGTIEENPIFDDEGNPVYIYSLRYEEFIALTTMVVQQQEKKIENMWDQIDDMRAQILELKDNVSL